VWDHYLPLMVDTICHGLDGAIWISAFLLGDSNAVAAVITLTVRLRVTAADIAEISPIFITKLSPVTILDIGTCR
jgi:hypothetical protein